jgi:alpha-L-fucosidase 2
MGRFAFAASLLASAPALWGEPSPNVLTYDRPATEWSREALPIGNGRLGAMPYGGVADERILLNEDSLWTGGANDNLNYITVGDRPDIFGAYQAVGDLHIVTGPQGPTYAGTAAGQPAAVGGEQSIDASHDGNVDTKWCFENHGKPTTWVCALPVSRVVTSYALTSAEDVPERDPRHWTFEGSQDGHAWRTLDTQALPGPFAHRHERRDFTLENGTAYKWYRFVFAPNPGVPHFQVAEISLNGVESPPPLPVSNYQRSLDIDHAIARVQYELNGVHYTRSVFSTAVDHVTVVRLEADRPGAYTGAVSFADAHGNPSASKRDAIECVGKFTNGLSFKTLIRVVPEGGTLSAVDDGQRFEKCDALTLVVDTRTNYVEDASRNWIGEPPSPRVEAEVDAAVRKGYAALLADHTADFKRYFDRVTLDVGSTAPAIVALPTDQRLNRYRAGGADPQLESTLFQYGRYLLISSSRSDLPANLQGLWNGSNDPPWAADYHTDINIQMNYWQFGVANLFEMHEPLLRFIKEQAGPARTAMLAAKKKFPGAPRGWTAAMSQSPRGANGWNWNIPSSAWYMMDVWEQYAFTGDKEYLRTYAYPALKQVCEFWQDMLVTLPDGTVTTPPSWSPEHGPGNQLGVVHDLQMVRELFTHTVAAADALGIDRGYRDTIASLKDRLAPNKIGSWGQLMEWQTEMPALEKSGHRHTSHLFSVYPGSDISVTLTPDLARAAQVSLLMRSTAKGDSFQSWTWPWRAALWARLRDGEHAHQMVRGELTNNAFPNLLTFASDVYQIDGDLGMPAAMGEMLLQSHAGEIHLLPALPKAWPTGSVHGLRARGGFTVDIRWENGRVTEYHVRSARPTQVTLRVNEEVKTVTSEADDR